MDSTTKLTWPGWALLISGLLLSSSAHSQLFTNLSIDPKALSLGNAVTADPPGINSIHYNPAGLSRLKGTQASFTGILGFLSVDAEFFAPEGFEVFGNSDDPVANTRSHTSTPALFVPLAGVTKLPVLAAPTGGFSLTPAGSKWSFGNALYAPMAAGFARSSDDPARFQGRELAIQRITYFSPTVAYQFNEKLSVGLSIGFSYQAIGLDLDFRTPNTLVGVIDELQEALCIEDADTGIEPIINFCGGDLSPFTEIADFKFELEDTLSPTFNIGVLWKPTDWFSWGAVYQSEGKTVLTGEYKIDYSEGYEGFFDGLGNSIFGNLAASILGVPTFGTDFQEGTARLELPFPARFQTGISVNVLPFLKVNIDAGWTDFKVWDEFRIEFDQTIDALAVARLLSPDEVQDGERTLILPRGYESVWSYGIGFELQATERLALRLGFEQRNSPIPDNRRDVTVPLAEAKLVSTGFGYQWDRDTLVEGAIAWLHGDENIPAGSSTNVNSTDLTNLIYNPFAGLDVGTTLDAWLLLLTIRHRF